MWLIRGQIIRLRPATLDDRRAIYGWMYESDIAPLLHLSGGATSTFEEFCEDWPEHFYTSDDPRPGRMYVIERSGEAVGVIANNEIDERGRVELDIWMSGEAHCGKGYGTDAVRALCDWLAAEHGVRTFMMQPSARNPRAIRSYRKAGFVEVPATLEQIRAEWGGVDHEDSVLMIREVGSAAR